MEVKENRDTDLILHELNGTVHNKRVEVFSQGGDGVLRYQGRLCVPDVGELKQHILAEPIFLDILCIKVTRICIAN